MTHDTITPAANAADSYFSRIKRGTALHYARRAEERELAEWEKEMRTPRGQALLAAGRAVEKYRRDLRAKADAGIITPEEWAQRIAEFRGKATPVPGLPPPEEFHRVLARQREAAALHKKLKAGTITQSQFNHALAELRAAVARDDIPDHADTFNIFDMDAGAIHAAGDASEIVLPDSETAQFITKREADYVRSVTAETGHAVPPLAVAKMNWRNDEIDAYSRVIAQKLAAAGMQGMREGPGKIFMVGQVTGEKRDIPMFTQSNIIPAYAQMARRKRALELEYWLSRPENEHDRMWVMTNGPRCLTQDMRKRYRDLNRRLSKLNAEPWFREKGVIVCRSVEFGTVEKENAPDSENAETGDFGGRIDRDEKGRPTWHPHLHVVFHPHKKMKKAEWTAFLARVRDFWGDYWHDAGIIGNAREVAKYVTKPQDMASLSPQELAAVYHQLFNARLFEFLGPLKTQYQQLKANDQKRVWTRTKDGHVLTTILDPNKTRRKKKTDAEKTQETVNEVVLGADKNDAGGDMPKLVARLMSMPNQYGFTEPFAVFFGTKWNPAVLDTHPLIAPYRAALTKKYRAAVAEAAANDASLLGFTRSGYLSEPEPPPKREKSGADGPPSPPPSWKVKKIEQSRAAKQAREAEQCKLEGIQ